MLPWHSHTNVWIVIHINNDIFADRQLRIFYKI